MFSIVIPTMQKNIKVFNMLLDELTENEYVGEIIIIDNSLLGIEYKSDKIRVITPSENIYVNPAWNLGVKISKYEYVGLLNDDLIFPINFFEYVHKFMESTDNIGYIGLEKIPKTKEENFLSYPDNTELKYNTVQERPDCWGSAIFFSKSNYFTIPEELKVWCGDDYIFYKSIDKGLTNYAISNSNIMHLHSLTSDRKEFDKIKYKDQKKYKKFNPKYSLLQEVQSSEYKFLQKIFSIKNEYNNSIKRKVITILGIKIKFKVSHTPMHE